MASLRPQIYLTLDQRIALDSLAEREGASLAELIREAVDEYLESRPVDVDAALSASFGTAKEAETPARSEWALREKRSVG